MVSIRIPRWSSIASTPTTNDCPVAALIAVSPILPIVNAC